MSSYLPPLCYDCKHFKGGPKFIGDSGKCTKFEFIPRPVFYQAGDCTYYSSAGKTAKKDK